MRNKYDVVSKKEVIHKYLSGQTFAVISRETGGSEKDLNSTNIAGATNLENN